MPSLSREIRFTVNPFSSNRLKGANSYCSSPSGEGLGLFFGLWVEVGGDVDADTGFVVNLVDIDRLVRLNVVPVFVEKICEKYRNGREVSFCDIVELLKYSAQILKDKFSPQKLLSLKLFLNPYRTLRYLTESEKVIYYSEKFEFAAMHRLWNSSFSDEKNFRIFGKCANPNGHGHNYIAEVTAAVECGTEFEFGSFQKVVDENFISILDHKNLNADVEYFRTANPTLENITRFGWKVLKDRIVPARLHRIKVWENNRAFCSYEGEAESQ
ncbi:6-pyruvoyl tetrahydropterin synthase/QueD family protein [Limihaloglobus sulfuriphilus]|uniref:6-carboxy-5,6,7,8-tetrahydropterin synthase n=1 Tax=Limihaloglobus sulfuriphilus TaxID=1851148 RepID=A0A1Q2MDW6_9BACT|nr:6-carboxytetrahydropterin synthase [Limihaloglobus sulfuriphilus]AQQ70885.1 6-pyruvoyl tetrahydropterin synthase/QueD family protein [Limihaloglobus sulfuriphilus]